MAFMQYLIFGGTPLPMPDSYEAEFFDTQTLEKRKTEMYIEGYIC